MGDLSEYGIPYSYTAEKLDWNEVIGKKLTVLDFELADGQFGKYAAMLVSWEGKERVVTCGGAAILKKLEAAKKANAFPATGTIEKRKSKNGREYLDFGR